jgi:DnaK suppressor protein
VSKSPAKKTPPGRAKAAVGKATAKAAPKRAAAAKHSARPAGKPSAKAKPSPRTVAKPTAKPHVAARKTPAKAPPRPAPRAAAAKTGSRAAPAKAAAPKPASKPASKPALSPVAARPTVPQPAPTPLPKTQDKPQAKPAQTAPAPNNRFAERFSPPRPPQRGLPEPIEPVRPAYKADPRLVNAWKTKAGRDLTEDELLAMPESEYMNEKQLEFFRARLQALKDDLLSNAGETTEHLREDTSIVPDPADRATIEEEHALELRTRDRERKLLKKISQSLARIDAGDYGYCDETGEPIGLGRLLARPTATLSLEAQQRRELKQKMFGD